MSFGYGIFVEVILLESAHKFRMSLEERTRSRINKYLEVLSDEGWNLRPPLSKKITSNLFELRVPGEQNIRLFYTFAKGSIFIVSGYVKKSQRLSRDEIYKAVNIINKFD
jgi:hypothetical protein